MHEPRRLGALRLAGLALVFAVPGLAQTGEADVALAKGRAAIARSDGIAAEIAFKDALARGASREVVAAGMGEALLDQGQNDKARQWLGPAKFAPGDELRGLRALSRLEIASGNLIAAGSALDKALAAQPRNGDLWVDIAQLRYRSGEQFQAIDAVDRALEADPSNLRALDFRGLIVRDQFGPGEALQWFERGLQIAPNDGVLLADYAATLGEMGRARQMLVVTRKLLELGAQTDRAFYYQAVLAARAGNYALSRAMLNRVGDRVSQTAAGLLLDALLDIVGGNGNLATEKLDRLAASQPQNEEVQLLLARALYAAGQQSKLVDRFGPVAQRDSTSPYLLTLVGRALEDLGRREDAAAYLDRASAVRPAGLELAFDPFVGSGAGEAERVAGQVREALRSGNPAGAAVLAARFHDGHGGLAISAVLAGDAQFAAGRFGDAISLYGAGSKVRFDDALLARMVLAAARGGQGAGAAKILGEYLTNHPQSRTAARIAADYAASVGDWGKAKSILLSLRETCSGRDARLLSDLAFAQLRSGDTAAAEATARAAFALQRSSPVAAQVWSLALAARREQSELSRALAAQARAGS